jgi:hypothetical protein
MKSAPKATWIGATAGAVVLLLAALANWRTVVSLLAFGMAERRPELLADARWHVPSSAVNFDKRFGHGAGEGALISWLRANRFQIDRSDGRAQRLVSSLPCNERIYVNWSTDQTGRIREATAAVEEAGCL